jgi:hypothetical protein
MIIARSVVKNDGNFKMVDSYEFDGTLMKRTTTWHLKKKIERHEYAPREIGEREFCDLLGALNRAFGLDALEAF